MSIPDLASEFPDASEQDWLKRVETVLKGKPLDCLTSRTLDGVEIAPLYQNDGPGRGPLAMAKGWAVGQPIDIPDFEQANRQALEDLENGASKLSLVLPGSVGAGNFGVPITSLDDLKRVFRDIELGMIGLRLDGGRHARPVHRLVLELYEARKLDLAACELNLCLDPLGAFAATGKIVSAPELARRMGETLKDVTDRGAKSGTFAADGRVYNGAGASEAQELAYVAATTIQYWRWLEAEGVDLADCPSQTHWILTADADQFVTIAKLRAARLLWQNLLDACGLPSQQAHLHVETSRRMMAQADAHVNMLRTTTAAFSAGVGGADSLTVLPFTSALGLADGFARRMARNVQLILQEESGINRVSDAAAGSGLVERLTSELGQMAWGLFQDIEASGGMMENLSSGGIAAAIHNIRDARLKNISMRKTGLTGVSEFPKLAPTVAGTLDVSVPEGWEHKLVASNAGLSPEMASCPPLAQIRDAAPFEQLQQSAVAAGATVFLANLGTPAQFTTRSTWVTNLLAAGGIGVAVSSGASSIDEVVNTFKNANGLVAIICSSDDVYEQMVVEVASALKAQGARWIILAGNPGAHEDAWRNAGVDEFVYAGLNALEFLSGLHKHLGLVSGNVEGEV